MIWWWLFYDTTCSLTTWCQHDWNKWQHVLWWLGSTRSAKIMSHVPSTIYVMFLNHSHGMFLVVLLCIAINLSQPPDEKWDLFSIVIALELGTRCWEGLANRAAIDSSDVAWLCLIMQIQSTYKHYWFKSNAKIQCECWILKYIESLAVMIGLLILLMALI